MSRNQTEKDDSPLLYFNTHTHTYTKRAAIWHISISPRSFKNFKFIIWIDLVFVKKKKLNAPPKHFQPPLVVNDVLYYIVFL